MSKIHILEPHLANMIAAGEVVERQSSVVKELVENSLDAHSQNITITLLAAGRELIEVSDDGDGMSKEDALLSLKRHATSKISKAYDLFKIHSLGFRGEALPSIASIASIEMLTSTGEKEGYQLFCEDEIISIRPAPLRKGTTVRVKNLFYNTPARLKYLKADYIENANTFEVVTKIALAYPEVSLKLIIDGRTVLFTTGKGDPLETVYRLYGVEVAEKIIPIDYLTPDFRIQGYLGLPEIAKSNRYSMMMILNKRTVNSGKVLSALIEAYKDFLPPVRFPFVILNLTVDPQLVDVNVHPSKKEVRFSKENELIQLLVKNIPQTLRSHNLIPKVSINKDEKPLISSTVTPSIYEKETLEEVTLNLFSSLEEETLSLTSPTQKIQKLYAKGQIRATYIVAEDESLSGFYLVDQHAADERINYEKNLALMKQDKHLTTPLINIILVLKPSEMALLTTEKIQLLEGVGLHIEVIGLQAVRVITLPVWAKNYGEEQYCENLITQVIHENKATPEDLYDDAIATKSCRASIMANENLTYEEMQHLLDELVKCQNPFACPHGRPTIVHFTNLEIEKFFKRTGF